MKKLILCVWLLNLFGLAKAQEILPPPPENNSDFIIFQDSKTSLFGVKNSSDSMIISAKFVERPVLPAMQYFRKMFRNIIVGRNNKGFNEYYTLSGKKFFTESTDSTFTPYSSKYYIINVKGKTGLKSGLFEYNGKEILPIIYDNIQQLTNDNLIVVSKKWVFGGLDINSGEVRIPFKFSYIDGFKEGKYEYSMAGKIDSSRIDSLNKKPIRSYGLIDKMGKTIIDFQYNDFGFYKNDSLFSFKKNGRYGIVNLRNKVVVSFEYLLILSIENGFARFVNANKIWGFINDKGKILNTEPFLELNDFDDKGFAWGKLTNNKWVEINQKGEIVKYKE